MTEFVAPVAFRMNLQGINDEQRMTNDKTNPKSENRNLKTHWRLQTGSAF